MRQWNRDQANLGAMMYTTVPATRWDRIKRFFRLDYKSKTVPVHYSRRSCR